MISILKKLHLSVSTLTLSAALSCFMASDFANAGGNEDQDEFWYLTDHDLRRIEGIQKEFSGLDADLQKRDQKIKAVQTAAGKRPAEDEDVFAQEHNDESPDGTLLGLPDELFVGTSDQPGIFSYLDPSDLAKLAPTCQRFTRLAGDDYLQRRVLHPKLMTTLEDNFEGETLEIMQAALNDFLEAFETRDASQHVSALVSPKNLRRLTETNGYFVWKLKTLSEGKELFRRKIKNAIDKKFLFPILAKASRLFNLYESNSNLFATINAFSSLSDDMKAVVLGSKTHIFKISKLLHPKEIRGLMEAVSQLTVEQAEAIFSNSVEFFGKFKSQKWSKIHIISRMKGLTKLSPEQIEAIAVNSSVLFEDVVTETPRARLIKVFEEFSADQIHAMGQIKSQLLENVTDPINQEFILAGLKPLSPEQIVVIGSNAEAFFGDSSHTYETSDFCSLFKVFKDFDVDQIEAIAANSKAIFSHDFAKRKALFVPCFQKLSPEQIDAVSANLMALIGNYEMVFLGSVMEELANLSVQHILAIAANASEIFDPKMEGNIRRNAIRDCADLSVCEISLIGQK